METRNLSRQGTGGSWWKLSARSKSNSLTLPIIGGRNIGTSSHCICCVNPLGKSIFSRKGKGVLCPLCHMKVCKNCRVYKSNNSSDFPWICTFCHQGKKPSVEGLLAPSMQNKKEFEVLNNRHTESTFELSDRRDDSSISPFMRGFLGNEQLTTHNIRRSRSISNPVATGLGKASSYREGGGSSSPILKSYTVIYGDDSVTSGSLDRHVMRKEKAVNKKQVKELQINDVVTQITTLPNKKSSKKSSDGHNRQFYSLPRMFSSGKSKDKKLNLLKGRFSLFNKRKSDSCVENPGNLPSPKIKSIMKPVEKRFTDCKHFSPELHNKFWWDDNYDYLQHSTANQIWPLKEENYFQGQGTARSSGRYSNRSSCERSLGEFFLDDYTIEKRIKPSPTISAQAKRSDVNWSLEGYGLEPKVRKLEPSKIITKPGISRRTQSMTTYDQIKDHGSYETSRKIIFSPLKTYCILSREEPPATDSYCTYPRTPRKQSKDRSSISTTTINIPIRTPLNPPARSKSFCSRTNICSPPLEQPPVVTKRSPPKIVNIPISTTSSTSTEGNKENIIYIEPGGGFSVSVEKCDRQLTWPRRKRKGLTARVTKKDPEIKSSSLIPPSYATLPIASPRKKRKNHRKPENVTSPSTSCLVESTDSFRDVRRERAVSLTKIETDSKAVKEGRREEPYSTPNTVNTQDEINKDAESPPSLVVSGAGAVNEAAALNESNLISVCDGIVVDHPLPNVKNNDIDSVEIKGNGTDSNEVSLSEKIINHNIEQDMTRRARREPRRQRRRKKGKHNSMEKNQKTDLKSTTYPSPVQIGAFSVAPDKCVQKLENDLVNRMEKVSVNEAEVSVETDELCNYLGVDKMSPSSSSGSSSTSYLSTLQQSYQLFHLSDQCEFLSDGEEDTQMYDELILESKGFHRHGDEVVDRLSSDDEFVFKSFDQGDLDEKREDRISKGESNIESEWRKLRGSHRPFHRGFTTTSSGRNEDVKGRREALLPKQSAINAVNVSNKAIGGGSERNNDDYNSFTRDEFHSAKCNDNETVNSSTGVKLSDLDNRDEASRRTSGKVKRVPEGDKNYKKVPPSLCMPSTVTSTERREESQVVSSSSVLNEQEGGDGSSNSDGHCLSGANVKIGNDGAGTKQIREGKDCDVNESRGGGGTAPGHEELVVPPERQKLLLLRLVDGNGSHASSSTTGATTTFSSTATATNLDNEDRNDHERNSKGVRDKEVVVGKTCSNIEAEEEEVAIGVHKEERKIAVSSGGAEAEVGVKDTVEGLGTEPSSSVNSGDQKSTSSISLSSGGKKKRRRRKRRKSEASASSSSSSPKGSGDEGGKNICDKSIQGDDDMNRVERLIVNGASEKVDSGRNVTRVEICVERSPEPEEIGEALGDDQYFGRAKRNEPVEHLKDNDVIKSGEGDGHKATTADISGSDLERVETKTHDGHKDSGGEPNDDDCRNKQSSEMYQERRYTDEMMKNWLLKRPVGFGSRESPEGQEALAPPKTPDDLIKPSCESEGDKLLSSKSSESSGIQSKSPSPPTNPTIITNNDHSSMEGCSLTPTKFSHRSSPDGSDFPPESPSFPPGSSTNEDEDFEEDADSWTVEEFDDVESAASSIIFEPEPETCNQSNSMITMENPPLDLTLHTIVEESCEEEDMDELNSINSTVNEKAGTRQKGLGHHDKSNRKEERFGGSGSTQSELASYFQNFDNDVTSIQKSNSFANEDTLSEFSDTFSESDTSSIYGLDKRDSLDDAFPDPTDEARGLNSTEFSPNKLEKYFMNLLPVPGAMVRRRSDSSLSSAGISQESAPTLATGTLPSSLDSQSDSDKSETNKVKTVKRRKRGKKSSSSMTENGSGAGSEDHLSLSSEEEESELPVFLKQSVDQFDTIKKMRSNVTSKEDATEKEKEKVKLETQKTSPEGSPPYNAQGSFNAALSAPATSKVQRSNSFLQWSSDEEVNMMMYKLKSLIKNMTRDQEENGSTPEKEEEIKYLESELVRLMKMEANNNHTSSDSSSVIQNSDASESESSTGQHDLVGTFSSELRANQNTKKKLLEVSGGLEHGEDSPPLMNKVMTHIGNRLELWMKRKDSDQDDDETGTLKCAPSVSSDLNEDRFSWKGSFESALFASNSSKRQSVGSTDSISSRGSTSNAENSSVQPTQFHTDRPPGGPTMILNRLSSSLHHLNAISSPIHESCESDPLGEDEIERESGQGSGGPEPSADGRERSSSYTSLYSQSRGRGEHDSSNYGYPSSSSRTKYSSNSKKQRMLMKNKSLCSSMPRLNSPTAATLSVTVNCGTPDAFEEEQSDLMDLKSSYYPSQCKGSEKTIKSARYRPPGFSNSANTSSSLRKYMPNSENRNVSSNLEPQESLSRSALKSQSTPALAMTEMDRFATRGSGAREFAFSQLQGSGEAEVVNVKGHIEFSLMYNYKLASLIVHVVQCKGLAPADSKKMRADPYVKAYLLPDKSKAGKRKTRTRKNTLNPRFDDTLKFPVSLSELQTRTLWLSVWHNDIFGRNVFLGQVYVELKDRVFDETEPTWWPLVEFNSGEKFGDEGNEEEQGSGITGSLVVALKWQPKPDRRGNLSVLIKEAKNLNTPISVPSTFIKCALLGDSRLRKQQQKTGVCRKTINPVWNQTLLFENIDCEGLEVSLWNYDLLSSHTCLGTIRLDPDHYLWQSMINRHSFWVEASIPFSYPS